MKKVIIITRTKGYIENGGSIEGREEFATAILNRNKPNKYSDKNLRKFLSAIEFTKRCGNVRTESEKRYAIKMGKGITKENQIKILLGSENFPNDDDIIGGDCCYVSFRPSKYFNTVHDKEIILVLWDELNGVKDEEVGCFELFIEQICKDCKLDENGQNYLYVHDKQRGQNGDITLLSEIDNEKDQNAEYNYIKKWFKYVALFAHKPESGFFKDNILRFKFGTPVSDQISKAESEVKSFVKLRESADIIIENF